MKAAVFGLGSTWMGDDAAGVQAVRLFEALYDCGPEVTVAGLWTPEVDLTACMAGHDVIILVDAVEADATPGSIRLYGKDALRRMPAQPRLSPHDPALKEALRTLELLDEMPLFLLLVGIVPESPGNGEAASAAVRAGIEEAATEVAVQLEALGFRVRPSAVSLALQAFPNSYRA
ncbi:MAG: hydrogenase maturation protease [Bryobacteraceae bacterium]|nr:hydrogenase maturation protease [Bryobacteraceae bacterium]